MSAICRESETVSTPSSPAIITIAASAPVSLEEVVAIADGARVALADDVSAVLTRGARVAADVAAVMPAYGRSTGVGANRETAVTERTDHGLRLVRSHATDAGSPLPSRIVRAMIATRLAQLSRGGSGIDPAIVPALAAALDQDEIVEIGSVGSIGTGDLAALAALALMLAGERAPGASGTPVGWGVESALPFLSSSALTIGRAVLASDELRRLDRAGRITFALTAAAVRANPSAWSDSAAAAAAAPFVRRVSAELRELVGEVDDPARIQDPFGLRVYPVTQAALLTSLERLDAQLHQLLNAAQENPVFDIDERTVTHHGAFFQAQLALDLDATTLAVAQAATNAHALLRLTNEPAYTRLRPFLATGPAGASGLMMLEYTAAAALAEIRNAANPATLGTIALSRGTEEDASFATQGAVQLERAVAAYRVVLACQLLAASRLLAQLDPELPAGLTAPATAVRSLQPHHDDQDLHAPLAQAASLLDELDSLVGPEPTTR